MKKCNRKRIAVDIKSLPMSYSDKGSMVLSAPTPKQFAKMGTYLMGEEPAQPSTKHVSNGSRFLARDPKKDQFYGE
jgi:hypothetical protein